MCQKEEASESFIPAVVLRPAYIYTFCLCSDVTSHSTLVTQTQLPKVIFIKAFQCIGMGRRSGLRCLLFCLLAFYCFFLEEKRKYQEYIRKENLPRQYCRTSKRHGRYSLQEDKRDTQARTSISRIYSSRDDKTCKAVIVTSLTLGFYPSKPKGTLL